MVTIAPLLFYKLDVRVRFVVRCILWVGSFLTSFKIAILFVLAFISTLAFGAGGVESKVESSNLTKNLKLLENYYQQVNEGLNSKLKDGARDPFQQLVLPPEYSASRNSIEQAAAKPASLSGGTSAPVVMRSIRGRAGLLPAMQFRGFMRVNGKNAALLDIAGVGSVVVKIGDKVGMGRVDNDEEMVIRIVEINALNVTVEVGSLGERVVVQ